MPPVSPPPAVSGLTAPPTPAGGWDAPFDPRPSGPHIPSGSMKLGEHFIQQGLLTQAQLEAALKAQLIFGGHLGTVLLEFGHVDEHTLGKTLAKIFNVDYAPPNLFTDIPKNVIDIVPKRLVEKHHVVPFDKRERNLAVAMIDPKDLRAIDEISFATGHRIHPWVAPEARIFQVMERYYDLPRRHRYISVCQTLDAAGSGPASGAQGPTARERAVLDSAYAPPPYLAALGTSETGPDSEGPPAAPRMAAGTPAPPTASLIVNAPAAAAIPALPVVAAMPAPATPAASPLPASAVNLAPAAAPAARVVPPPAMPSGPMTEAALSDELCRCESASEIADVTVRYLASRLTRAILFLVRGDTATLWKAHGLTGDKTPSLLLPLTTEPLFALLHERDSYCGPLPTGSPALLLSNLGMAPPNEIVLLPGYLDDRLLVIVYGDGGAGASIQPDVGDLRPIVTKVACALHLVALKRRIRSGPETAAAAPAPKPAAKAA